MNAALQTSPTSQTHRAGNAMALALRLAHAENALHALTSGQIDAIVNADGQTYLMRPAQEQLRQNEKRLQALLDSVTDVITVVSRAGAILSQNQAVTRVLGYEPEELVGSLIFKYIHDEDIPVVYSAFFNVVEGLEDQATACFRHEARDGSYVMIEATMSQLRDASLQRVVFSLRPITDPLPNRSKVEVVHHEPELGTDLFLAMLSHELRTPLTPVLFGVHAMQGDERFAAALPTLAMIQRNIELQGRLLEELDDFTTVSQYKVRLRLEPIDAHETIRLVLEICRSEIAAMQIEVRLDLRAANHTVRADSVRLQQVIWNLVKNAIKFSARGSSISIVSANDMADGLALEFIDHGIGIEPELLPLMFDPLQQGDHAMQKPYGGLGLGLFIARGLAEAQQGTLTAVSDGLGHGATFRLNFKTAL